MREFKALQVFLCKEKQGSANDENSSYLTLPKLDGTIGTAIGIVRTGKLSRCVG